MSPDPEIVNDIAVELGVSAAFVEKDWFFVQVLKAIAGHESGSFRAVFSGGTSLSKGYALIQRFSEDLDFRCLALRAASGNQMRKMRREYRVSVMDAIGGLNHLVLDREQASVGSNYVKLELGYPQNHVGSSALRAGLQVEFSFTQPQLDVEARRIQSLVSRFSGGESEVEILCLSPVETAADKLSALVWRVSKRDRTAADDDPAMIRHLHDIAALMPIIEQNRSLFTGAVAYSFETDQRTSRRDTGESLPASIRAMIKRLKNDGQYRNEYRSFVEAMTYADDGEGIDFDSAMVNLDGICGWFS